MKFPIRLMFVFSALAFLAVGALRAETLRFVTEPFPPYNYEQEGRAVGPMPEIVRAACVRIAIHCNIEVMPWRRALQMAEQGKADGVFSLVWLPEREARFHLGPPVVELTYSLFAQTASPMRYQRLADLNGYTLAAYGPSGTQRTLEELQAAGGQFDIVQEIDNLTALRKLAAGRYGERSAVLINRDVAYWLIREEHLDNLKVVGDVRRLAYHIGLSRQSVSEATANRFDQALVALGREGQLRAILKKYGLRPPAEQ
jgi:polar amino acid transport system substrate-binding protein